MARPGLTAAPPVTDALRLPAPRVRRRILLTARVLIVAAALITLVAVQHLTALTLSLFLIVGQACIVVGALLALGVAVTDVFRRRGVTQLRFEPGDVVFRQGEPGDLAFSIVSGEVEILREMPDGGERLLATMGPGEYFGEMALISDAARTATVRARTAVEVVGIGRADFTTLYAYLPGFQQRVETLMRQRAADTAEKTR
ncbi:MAG: cyclic nucleotide-binding domain-containing protein [Deltaproteobacteria bacterium]|nr:cyclic nucleotide-binding domain-containing protein [Deltaproteobacteria bacterium]